MCTLSLLHVVLPLPGVLCPWSPHDWILLTVQSWIQIAPPSRSPPWSSYHAFPSSCPTASPALAYHPQFSLSSPSSWSEVNLLVYILVNYLPPLQNLSSCRVEPLSVFFMAVFPVPRIVIGTELGLHNCVFSEWMNEWLKGFHYLDSVLKSRDITLLTKVHIVKAMVFPVVMYGYEKLDHKECWVPKNWCFQIVVREKTLESLLDCKKIQPVNPKGNQPWIFIGRTDAEVEAPVLWQPDGKTHWKRPWFWERLRAGGEGGNRRWDGWITSLTQLTWVWANSRR